MLLGKKRSTAHGSAGWGQPPKEFWQSASRPLSPGTFFLGMQGERYLTLPLDKALRHSVVLGPSGTGKSTGFYLPNCALAYNTSLVCTDVKGELWKYTSGYHDTALRFAPTDPQGRSECFNFLPLCRSARFAELCARALVLSGQTQRSEQAWIDLECAYLSALFAHTATLPEPTLLTAYQLLTRMPQEQLIGAFLASPSSAAVDQATIFLQTQERMRGSIVPVVASKLQFMRDSSVTRFTSATLAPPDFASLRHRPQAVYYVLREQDATRLKPLTSVFFTVVFEQLAAEETAEGARSIPIACLLDEFATIGILPDFASTLAVARGRQIAISIGIQSIGQLAANYGDDAARVILDNLSTKIALSSLDYKSAEYISKTLGEETLITTRRARNRRWFLWEPVSTTTSQLEHARPLATPDEVRRLSDNEAIVVCANLRPMKMPKYRYVAPPREAPAPTLPPARAVEMPRLSAPKKRLELPPLPEDLLRQLTFDT